MASMNQIRSERHEIYSIKLNKIGLSPYDDKRYILNDGTNTLAYGHYETIAKRTENNVMYMFIIFIDIYKKVKFVKYPCLLIHREITAEYLCLLIHRETTV